MIQRLLDSAWGQATHLFTTPVKGRRWLDLLVLAAMAGLVMAFLLVAKEWTGAHRPAVEIDLRASALPTYMLLSLVRASVAYLISITLTFTLAYWAAKDAFAEKLLIPILDILQSVPLLAFLPPVILAMTRIFPRSNIGLELSAAILIVTCQAWNMIFSFYQSLKTVPPELSDLAQTYQLSWYQKLRWIELPYATPGLAWNSMVSVANGWFFLMAAEAFSAGGQNFLLPGLGAYMQTAVDRGDHVAEVTAIGAVLLLVVVLDRLLWKPVMAWSQRFQLDENLRPERPQSWLLTLLRRSRLLRWLEYERTQRLMRRIPRPQRLIKGVLPSEPRQRQKLASFIVAALFGLVLLALALAAFKLARILSLVGAPAWLRLLKAGGASFARVMLSTLLATLWTVPAGLWIGMNPKWAKRLQPAVQVAVSYPVSLLFAAITTLLLRVHLGLGASSILLMVLSTQWYLLFNIIAGAQAIPGELREMGRAFRLNRWGRFKTLYLPAIFPFLVTGWVTATGGAWNASIITEFVSGGGHTYATFGLGSELQLATSANNLPMVAASSLLMAGLVVLFNRLVWVPLYRMAEQRYTLEA
ncbi:MAG TPA: ABC transporter permease subunit [Holophagaceae bacterium]|nr:ABC transporter permease subunit [Holophagaceae bacterium]